MSNYAARLISIFGHPAVLMPAASLIASSGTRDNSTTVMALLLASTTAAGIMFYSFVKKRRGDWAHIDASAKSERVELTRILGPSLLAIAGILQIADLHPGISIVLGLCGGIVVAAHLLRRLSKPSLHVAFASFATLLVWPNLVASVGLGALTALVAWSRLRLERHTGSDVMYGLILGISAGLIFQGVIRYFDA